MALSAQEIFKLLPILCFTLTRCINVNTHTHPCVITTSIKTESISIIPGSSQHHFPVCPVDTLPLRPAPLWPPPQSGVTVLGLPAANDGASAVPAFLLSSVSGHVYQHVLHFVAEGLFHCVNTLQLSIYLMVDIWSVSGLGLL